MIVEKRESDITALARIEPKEEVEFFEEPFKVEPPPKPPSVLPQALLESVLILGGGLAIATIGLDYLSDHQFFFIMSHPLHQTVKAAIELSSLALETRRMMTLGAKSNAEYLVYQKRINYQQPAMIDCTDYKVIS